MNAKEFYSGLSDEVKEKIRACRSEEEMRKVLEDARIELSPELLESVSGGTLPPKAECKMDKDGQSACSCD